MFNSRFLAALPVRLANAATTPAMAPVDGPYDGQSLPSIVTRDDKLRSTQFSMALGKKQAAKCDTQRFVREDRIGG
ncbi:MAG: hypothetical protein ABIP49_06500 [Lysobacterales bacterium]